MKSCCSSFIQYLIASVMNFDPELNCNEHIDNKLFPFYFTPRKRERTWRRVINSYESLFPRLLQKLIRLSIKQLHHFSTQTIRRQRTMVIYSESLDFQQAQHANWLVRARYTNEHLSTSENILILGRTLQQPQMPPASTTMIYCHLNI